MDPLTTISGADGAFPVVAAAPAPAAATVPPSSLTPLPTPAYLSPASGVPNWQTRNVSECVFDALHWELVSYFSKQLRHELSGEDAKLVSKRIHSKIESVGFSVGARYAERYSKDHPFLEQPLDVVKYMCKEFWMLLYKKQVDKLQTNYKGIYVLHDFNFRWLSRVYALSSDMDSAQLVEQSRVYTSLACGIIRGALWNLGLHASVKADLKLPAVQFTIVEEKSQHSASGASTGAAPSASPAKPTATAAAAATGNPPRSSQPPSASTAMSRPRTSIPNSADRKP